MKENDKDRDEVDALLDGALSEYSGAEPLAGLEDRVLARIRLAEPRPRRRLLWGLALAGSAVAAVCLLLILDRPGGAGPVAPAGPEPQAGVRAEAQPAPPPAETTVEPFREALPPAQQAARAWPAEPMARVLPKQEQFPTPAPLTRAEQALLAFAAQHPEQARELLSAAADLRVDPIEIEPIRIDPLPDGGD